MKLASIFRVTRRNRRYNRDTQVDEILILYTEYREGYTKDIQVKHIKNDHSMWSFLNSSEIFTLRSVTEPVTHQQKCSLLVQLAASCVHHIR